MPYSCPRASKGNFWIRPEARARSQIASASEEALPPEVVERRSCAFCYQLRLSPAPTCELCRSRPSLEYCDAHARLLCAVCDGNMRDIDLDAILDPLFWGKDVQVSAAGAASA